MTRILFTLLLCFTAILASATVFRVDAELCNRVKAAQKTNDQAAAKATAAGKKMQAAQKALEKAQAAYDKANDEFTDADAALRKSVEKVKEAQKSAAGANCLPPPGRKGA